MHGVSIRLNETDAMNGVPTDTTMKHTLLGLLLTSLWITSCAPYLHQPLRPTQARLGAESGFYHQLKALPEPQEKVVAAVYKFRDQTGQYKPSEVGASWSTAVTQGATAILQRALEESGWFTTIEREGLSNLLNERKIIRSSRQAFDQQNGVESSDNLPPLLFAGILIEGGIVSYDANVLTGGAGARYFGVGGNAQYRQDRVTVYLRATSTSNGRILKTIYTSRTILSQKVDAGLFKFVSFQRLMEAETGFTHNEPSELAVREAIEKGVHALVVEGIQDGLWTLKNQEEIYAPTIAQYQREVVENEQTDYLGRRFNQFQRNRLSVGGSLGTFRYAGDYPNPLFQTAGEVQVMLQTNPWLSIGLKGGRGSLAGEGVYRQTFNYLNLATVWRIFPQSRFTPLFKGEGGWISRQGGEWDQGYPQTVVGLGAEYLVNNQLGIQAGVQYHYTLSDELDQVQQGKFNDYFYAANLGVNLYFGRTLK